MDDDWDFFDDPKPSSNTQSIFKEKTKTTSTNKLYKSWSSNSSQSDSEESNLHGTDQIRSDSNSKRSENVSDTENQTQRSSSSTSSRSTSVSSTKSNTSNKQSNGTYTKEEESNTSESEDSEKNYSQKSPIKDKYQCRSYSSDASNQSSESVTDVSPLSTPEASPKLRRKSRRSRDHANTKHENNKQLKHVTKLNVTFGSKPKPGLPEKQRYQHPINYSDYDQDPLEIYRQQLQQSYNLSSSSDEEYVDDSKYWGPPKSGYNRRRNEAIEKHRKRLLSASANRTMDISRLLETVLDFDKQRNQRQQNRNRGDWVLSPGRKNMSFTNMQVNEIDRENNRLLKEITKSRRVRPSSASSIRSTTSNASSVSRSSRQSQESRSGSRAIRRQSNPQVKLYHSAQNRIQYQRQIERENLQLLKRLRSAKGTPDLRKAKQLDDYKRQTKYMGASIEHSGMTARQANELTRNAEVVRDAIGFKNSRRKPVRPTWQDAW